MNGKEFWNEVRQARETVNKYSEEQKAVVRGCLDEIGRLVNEYWDYDDEETLSAFNREISNCQRDWSASAYEDELLNFEEWEELYDAMDFLDTLKAQAYA